MNHTLKKSLSIPFLINLVRREFSKIPDPRKFSTQSVIPLVDHLLSGLAVFGLKFPSLLQYDQKRNDPLIRKNLQVLYQIKTPPSDSYLEERLDQVDPESLRPAFKKLFALFQRSKGLEEFLFLDGYYLLSLDGTGKFSSSKISCKHCCKKEHKNGLVTYYHQMLGGCIVHPKKSNVIPLCPEMIQNGDGSTKNDCERNASARFIKNFRREHPHLKVIIIEDGLASNGPHIDLLTQYKMKYIIGAKPGDHAHLFEQAEKTADAKCYQTEDEKGNLHQFRFINGISLNKSHPNLKVNFIEYRETRPNGKELNFSWVTNIPVKEKNVYQLMRGGRARWKIENETYNTLKNLGYNSDHSYGHGKKYLTAIFCMLMMLAFLIDQIQGMSCHLFRFMKKFAGSYRALWEQMRAVFIYKEFHSWEEYYCILAKVPYQDST